MKSSLCRFQPCPSPECASTSKPPPLRLHSVLTTGRRHLSNYALDRMLSRLTPANLQVDAASSLRAISSVLALHTRRERDSPEAAFKRPRYSGKPHTWSGHLQSLSIPNFDAILAPHAAHIPRCTHALPPPHPRSNSCVGPRTSCARRTDPFLRCRG